MQVFVDGRAPGYLRPFYGGGSLVGMAKDGKPLDEDARPLVVGEVWRRLACKVALAGEKGQLRERLGKEQLAVGVPAGAEVAVHMLRQFCARHLGNTKTVLLKVDYENAFNEADEHELLCACYEDMPSCARLAEWLYGEPVFMSYNGEKVESSKGQQGCPLMMPIEILCVDCWQRSS